MTAGVGGGGVSTPTRPPDWLTPNFDCRGCGRTVLCMTPGATAADEWRRCKRCGRIPACGWCGVTLPPDRCDCCRVCGALEDLHDGDVCAGCCEECAA